MSSNVHALDRVRALQGHGEGRPERAEVEAAIRTVIRWTGDDPRRDPDRYDTNPRGSRRDFRDDDFEDQYRPAQRGRRF